MPTLHEYLGGLVSSITDARAQSDIQSVMVAEEYRKHPYLRHYAIPRMRIRDVELTVPVALEGYEVAGETTVRVADTRAFNSVVYNRSLQIVGMPSLPAAQSRGFRSFISGETKVLEKRLAATGDVSPLDGYAHRVLSHLLTLNVRPTVRADARKSGGKAGVKPSVRVTPGKGQGAVQPNVDLNTLKVRLVEALEPELIIDRKSEGLEHLEVVVEADKIREKMPESLVYIKMKVVEEGVEWHAMETPEGTTEHKLLPE